MNDPNLSNNNATFQGESNDVGAIQNGAGMTEFDDLNDINCVTASSDEVSSKVSNQQNSNQGGNQNDSRGKDLYFCAQQVSRNELYFR